MAVGFKEWGKYEGGEGVMVVLNDASVQGRKNRPQVGSLNFPNKYVFMQLRCFCDFCYFYAPNETQNFSNFKLPTK